MKLKNTIERLLSFNGIQWKSYLLGKEKKKDQYDINEMIAFVALTNGVLSRITTLPSHMRSAEDEKAFLLWNDLKNEWRGINASSFSKLKINLNTLKEIIEEFQIPISKEAVALQKPGPLKIISKDELNIYQFPNYLRFLKEPITQKSETFTPEQLEDLSTSSANKHLLWQAFDTLQQTLEHYLDKVNKYNPTINSNSKLNSNTNVDTETSRDQISNNNNTFQAQ